jgi:Na+-driven multidrug efflux pump
MFAALATSISYFMCFLCSVVFVYKSELRLKVRHFIHLPIIKEITALSFVTFSRQVVSILAIILNHTLYSWGEHSIAVYG